MSTAYVLDSSTIGGVITLGFAFCALCTAYYSVKLEDRPAARAACASGAFATFAFIIFLIACYPPKPYRETSPEKCDVPEAVPQKIIIYEDLPDSGMSTNPKAEINAPQTTPPVTPVTPAAAETQQSWCETQAARTILRMIDRCGTYTVCPTELANLGDITVDEQREIMQALPKASIFFPANNANDPISTMDSLTHLVKAKTSESVLILIGRSSKKGRSRANKDLSRRRVLHVKHYIDEKIAPTETMLAYYGEDVLQLTRKDAEAFKVDGDLNIDQLNQSVFAFRFDCPRRK